MVYSFNTFFRQMDRDNNVIGQIDLHTNLDTTGYFDCGIEVYKNLLGTLLESLGAYEEEVTFNGQ